MPLLDVRNLTKDFGGLRANDAISFALDKDELLGVIGPNGAGKTTLFNCIAGLHPVTAGQIIFDGGDITRLPAYEVARRGLARTFQVYVASGDLSVLENVMVGAFMRTRERAQARRRAEDILERLNLRELARRHAERTAGRCPKTRDHGDRSGHVPQDAAPRRGRRRP